MSASPPPPTSPPAGWYRDPSGAPTQRYWDGARWTEQLAPMQPPAVVEKNQQIDVAAIVLAVLLPIVGLACGIVALARGRTRSGLITVAVSIIVPAIYIVAFGLL